MQGDCVEVDTLPVVSPLAGVSFGEPNARGTVSSLPTDILVRMGCGTSFPIDGLLYA